MRVAIVAGPYVPVPPKKYGGIEHVIYYLIKGLQEMGHEPILLGPADSKVNCELIPTTDRSLGFAKSPAERRRQLKLIELINKNTTMQLRKLLRRIDIIHSHGFDMAGFKNFPNLTTLHNPIIFSDLSYYLKRKTLNYVAISNNYRLMCPDLNYVATIYNGEDPSRFPVVEKPDNYLSFLGRMDRGKNPHLAIELAIALGMKIKLAGKVKIEDDGIHYFKHEIKPYLRHPLVEWLGELGEKKKIELVSRARCNLHPTSFREPFGLTVLEAAYCGTPTLAINRGAMPELIENDRSGVLVQDYIEGYYRIQNCFKLDRSYVAERARKLFNYQRMTRQYLRAYQKVIKMTSSQLK